MYEEKTYNLLFFVRHESYLHPPLKSNLARSPLSNIVINLIMGNIKATQLHKIVLGLMKRIWIGYLRLSIVSLEGFI